MTTTTTPIDGTADFEVRTMTMSQAINLALRQAMGEDDRVIILGEDITDPGGGTMKCTLGLSTEFGTERVRDTPIAEQSIIGAAIGAAIAGLRPVAEIMLMDFMAVCMDQLVNHAAKLRYMSGGRTGVPMTVLTAVIAGAQSGAQHSQSTEAWLVHTPGLYVAIPSNPSDAKGMLATCIDSEDPCVFIESSPVLGATAPTPVDPSFRVPLGSARVVRRGTDVTIASYGWAVREALAAAEVLAGDDISAEVVDLRWLAPLDMQTVLNSAERTGRLLVTHASTEVAGVGAEIAAQVASALFGRLKAPVWRLGSPAVPTPYAKELERMMYPTSASITAAAKSLMEGGS